MNVRIPMRAGAEVSDVERFVADDEWAFEQKMDGTRGLAVITSANVWWPGYNGRGSLAHTAATQHWPRINPVLMRLMQGASGELVLDGEVMIETGEYRVWDVPYLRMDGVEHVRPTDPFHERRKALLGIALDFTDPVALIPQARGRWEKKAMLERVHAGGGEGLMAKRLDSAYESAGRSMALQKIKFVSTADVVVTASTRSRNAAGRETGSFAFSVYNEAGELVPLGACSAIGKPEVAVGDVIEVKYLSYWGGALVQPRMVRVRDDKPAEACVLTQLRHSVKEVL